MAHDIVFIKNLKLDVIIGIYDHERTQTQPITLNVEMAWDNRPAGKSDDITLTLDYEKVSNYIKAFARDSAFLLVERFTEVLAEKLIMEFNIEALTLELNKLTAIPGTDAVGVKISRTKADYLN
ncbi:MAG: dihydroneopterin aldolase [Xanthomonadaceae bacterium]|nr:dihydroneopterin aldolase [Xanthomonadaceae bacterium]